MTIMSQHNLCVLLLMSKYSGNLDFLNYKSSMSIVILIVSFYFYLQFALTPTFNLVETG